MITKQEYLERVKRLQNRVKGKDLGAFLVTAQDSIYYLTGVTYVPLERPFFMIVYPDDDSILLSPALDQEHLRTATDVETVRRYWDYPSPSGQGWPERLHDLLAGVNRLGVEPSLPQEIAMQLGPYNPVVYPLVETMRLVKSPDEVKMLRQAAHFAKKGMEAIIKASYKGVSEIEIFSLGRSVQMAIIKTTEFDPLNTSVLTAAWPARLGLQPHGVPLIGDRLHEGPHIALSFMRVNGYGAECERTYFVARPTNEMKKMFKTMQEARQRGFQLIKPGVSCAEIDRAANGFLRQEGLGDYLLHRTGHGFGLGNHEGPWVAEGSEDILTENMLISMEPGIYVPDLGAFRHSDTLLVTEDGYENLTPYPDDLDSLTIRKSKLFNRLRGSLVRRAVGVT
ncbi:MAG: Xaa-Pro peptidase family protein [Thermodesulfobacteriota bacterium]|nr:Xaa-Pro peptidase family protein [Thermodesulfobacteriota bacterium]